MVDEQINHLRNLLLGCAEFHQPQHFSLTFSVVYAVYAFCWFLRVNHNTKPSTPINHTNPSSPSHREITSNMKKPSYELSPEARITIKQIIMCTKHDIIVVALCCNQHNNPHRHSGWMERRRKKKQRIKQKIKDKKLIALKQTNEMKMNWFKHRDRDCDSL